MRLGLSEIGRKGVYGLGGLWRIVWCMAIGVIGAAEGLGAYKNGKIIRVRQKEKLKECYVAYGYPSRAKRDLNAYWNIFREIFDKVGAMRRPGAAAIDLCLLAEGVFDGLLEFELNPWDVVSGTLIAKEAGAKVALSKGFSLGTDVYAGNEICFPFIEKVIKLNLEELVSLVDGMRIRIKHGKIDLWII